MTGSGIAYVSEVLFDKIKIGKFVLHNVLIYAHDFPEESFTTGVIGLNVISAFDVNLIFSKRLIEITQHNC